MKLSSLIYTLILSQLVIANTYAQEKKQETTTQTQSAASASVPVEIPTPAIPTPPTPPILEKIDTVPGTGKEAQPGKTVQVHYTGWLRDPQAEQQHGKAFDSSVGRGPFNFNLGEGRVIKGWEQGVSGMKVGGKRTLVIPSHLAYGPRGAGKGVIPPDADLIFDIELLDVIDLPDVEKTDQRIGKGDACSPGKTVLVHYTGWLRDTKAKNQKGKEFDSSRKREPFQFTLNAGQVIRGWELGVAGMKVGGKRTLVIPAALAYGARDIGDGLIPANSDLIFEVQLLKIK